MKRVLLGTVGIIGLVGLITGLAGCGSGSAGTEVPSLTNTVGPSSTTSERPSGPPVRAHGSFLVRVGGYPADLYLVNAAGGGPRLVAKGVLDVEPSWFPDGTRFLASVEGPGRRWDVVIYRITGGEPLKLTHTGSAAASYAQVSPDGKRIAYLAGGNTSLWVVPATGGSARYLTRAVLFAWSPDSRRLAISTDNPPGIAAVPTSGGRESTLATGWKSPQPREWGPDGRLLYIVPDQADRPEVGFPPVTYLWTGTTSVKIGYTGGAEQFLPDGTVAFLDGRGIGFLKRDNTLRITGPLPEDRGGTSAAWSTDGRYLAFASDMTGHVYVARADGSGARRLPLEFGRGRQITVYGWRPHGAGKQS